jgi:hydroxyacylglutathione hydrolase
MELLPNIHIMDEPGRANCYLIVGDGETTMIDAGMKGDVAKVSALLRKNGVPVGGLQNIVITHAHADHYQGVAAVKKTEGGRLLVHDADAVYVEGKKAPLPKGPIKIMFFLLGPMIKCPPAKVDCRLNDGDVIDTLGGLKVVYLPGHTSGNIALYSEKRKVLFCGDTLGNRENQLGVPFGYKYSQVECNRTFARLAELDVEVLLPGHGTPILKGAGAKLHEFSEKINRPSQRTQ